MVNLKTIIIIYLYEFKLYMVSELQFTHFLSHDFLKYVMVSHIYRHTFIRLITSALCVQ